MTYSPRVVRLTRATEPGPVLGIASVAVPIGEAADVVLHGVAVVRQRGGGFKVSLPSYRNQVTREFVAAYDLPLGLEAAVKNAVAAAFRDGEAGPPKAWGVELPQRHRASR